MKLSSVRPANHERTLHRSGHRFFHKVPALPPHYHRTGHSCRLVCRTKKQEPSPSKTAAREHARHRQRHRQPQRPQQENHNATRPEVHNYRLTWKTTTTHHATSITQATWTRIHCVTDTPFQRLFWQKRERKRLPADYSAHGVASRSSEFQPRRCPAKCIRLYASFSVRARARGQCALSTLIRFRSGGVA